jgi:hypothetical protein
MHPFALAPRRHHPGAPQVCQVARNLWLTHFQYFNEKADTDFVLAHQVDQTQARPISQRLEKQFRASLWFIHFNSGVIDQLFIALLLLPVFHSLFRRHIRRPDAE